MAGSLSARALHGLPDVKAGDDLAALIVAAALRDARSSRALRDGQIVAVAHKVVSKAEGSVVALADIHPSPRAQELATAQSKDARAVQVVLDQSAEIVRAERDVLICRTHHGFVCANAGVDASNARTWEGGTGESGTREDGTGESGTREDGTGESGTREDGTGESGTREDGTGESGTRESGTLILLPRDPDTSARRLRARLRELTGATVAVLITDSFGRAWRHGQCDVTIGCAGMTPLENWRGRTDAAGMELRATWLAVADAAAATADLARAKDSREPVVLIDGLERFVTAADGPGAMALLRTLDDDLFR
jgi:coenzyme F420-0:L-glutamate ligase / coenzyme F420-1:gamma-L-glutamate ligase